MKKPSAPTINDVLSAVSDEQCIKFLEAVATNGDGSLLAQTLQMTRKVFYDRAAELRRKGLITGRNGKYSLTGFGRIIYNTQKTIAKALDRKWKLTAIDSIRTVQQLSPEDYAKVIDRLLDVIELKDIILSKRVNRGNETVETQDEAKT
jgi:predicted transcriptional regulator